MSLFNVVLWDFCSDDMLLFYTNWRKAIRKLLCLPMLCHNNLSHLIVDDMPVDNQVYKRFLKFLKNICNSNNSVIQLLGKLVIYGSSSTVSNNLSLICNVFSVNRNVCQFNMNVFSLTDSDDIGTPDSIVIP